MSIGKSSRSVVANAKVLDNAVALHQGGSHDEALELYRDILTTDPTNSVALVYGGVALLETGQVVEAISQLEAAVELHPNMADIHGYLANALQLANRPEAAERHYHRATDLEPGDPTLHGNFGAFLMKQDRLQEAMERFYRAIILKPNYGPAFNNLCECLRRQGKTIEAVEAGEQAINIDPESAEAHENLGGALIEAQRVEDAIAAYRRAVEIGSNPIDALNNLSIALIIGRQLDDALTITGRCLDSDAGNIQAIATQSIALQELGDSDGVEALLDYNLLTRETTIDVPSGYETLADFNEALADHVRTHPTLVEAPDGNATRAGMHSGDLLAEPAGPFRAFEAVIRDEVSAYLKSIPQGVNHPFFAKYPAQYALDVWGIVLTGEGHQIPHIHPSGWLSGCYYPKVPPDITPDDPGCRGWFEFGRPQPLYDAQATPNVREICPRESLLLLFPSFIFHRTIPSETTEERISIAFDVRPIGYCSSGSITTFASGGKEDPIRQG
ncbi:MAG: tetratricopeptide repeat protein [Rhodospirillaceae bacterium]|nr:tetratricopeptide repeat protein [Rhodospirillaceae bacterium]MBT5455371.1 tetratricopeptide repeat protein [Rhodospirillaceae bacterium]